PHPPHPRWAQRTFRRSPHGSPSPPVTDSDPDPDPNPSPTGKVRPVQARYPTVRCARARLQARVAGAGGACGAPRVGQNAAPDRDVRAQRPEALKRSRRPPLPRTDARPTRSQPPTLASPRLRRHELVHAFEAVAQDPRQIEEDPGRYSRVASLDP